MKFLHLQFALPALTAPLRESMRRQQVMEEMVMSLKLASNAEYADKFIAKVTAEAQAFPGSNYDYILSAIENEYHRVLIGGELKDFK